MACPCCESVNLPQVPKRLPFSKVLSLNESEGTGPKLAGFCLASISPRRFLPWRRSTALWLKKTAVRDRVGERGLRVFGPLCSGFAAQVCIWGSAGVLGLCRVQDSRLGSDGFSVSRLRVLGV